MRRRRNRRRDEPTLALRLKNTATRVVPLLLTAGLVSGCLCLLVWGGHALYMAPFLRVRHIHVEGQQALSRQDILAHVALVEGAPMFGLELDRLALELERLDWVKSVHLRRRWPDTVFIHVEEYTAAVAVALHDVYLADARGQVFRKLLPSDGIVLPVLTGLGQDVVGQSAEALREPIVEALQLLERVDDWQGTWGTVDELNWHGTLGWSVLLRRSEGRTWLHLGKRPRLRLPVAQRVLEFVRARGRHVDAIWIDNDKAPTRAHVKLSRAGRGQTAGPG